MKNLCSHDKIHLRSHSMVDLCWRGGINLNPHVTINLQRHASMATPNEKLAASLDRLKELQAEGRRVFESKELTRVHRDRLIKNGFLREVVKGWLVTTNPGADEGDTTPWYTSFWEFCARYCNKRFGRNWHLSPEQSLLLHGENTIIPRQVVVYAQKGTNNTVNLLFDTSLYDLKQAKKQWPPPADFTIRDGLRLYAPAAALIRVPEHFFQRAPVEAQVVLASFRDASELTSRLLEGGHTAVASRLAGAFKRVGRPAIASEIIKAMKAADYDVRETDPFAPQQRLASLSLGISPVVGRVKILWDLMRTPVLELAPPSPGLPKDKDAYLSFIDDLYKSDAYHSLSIEGYTVTPGLIERVRSGDWNPDSNPDDRQSLNALAARGYWQAFRRVKETVSKLIRGVDAGALVREDHRDWYREMFQPAVAAGLLRPAVLAGYRNQPVYLKASRHVPPRWEAVADAMSALFDLLEQEDVPFVRTVLGHWMLGYIHPYHDGNGRMARFLMNAMLAAGGYPWTVIRVEDRGAYLDALESASSELSIGPFATFIANRIQGSMELTLQAASAPVSEGRMARRSRSPVAPSSKRRRQSKNRRRA
jgi:fido (protein-threonine AMPylation protein)